MALIELRRKIFPNNTGIGAPFVAQTIFWDEDARRTYPTQMDSPVSDPRELPKNAPVASFEARPGKTLDVFYNGNGGVYTKPQPLTLLNNVEVKLGLLPIYVSSGGASDACVDITGRYGLPPYRIELRGTSGPANGYFNNGTPSPSELFPVRFYNLREGSYSVVVRDALNRVNVSSFTITANGGEAMTKELRADYNAVAGSTLRWSYNGQNILTYLRPPAAPRTDQLPYLALVDGFFSASNTNWRRVYSDGVGGVLFEDFPIGVTSELALENPIIFHPDSDAEQNGGLLLEMRATHPPLSFQLTGTTAAGPISQTNATGHFDGLAGGSYTVLVTDALGKSVTLPFELRVSYGKRYVLEYSEVSGIPLRLELWMLGYSGAVEAIKGQANPVTIKTDGLNSELGGQGDIGPVVGTTAELKLKVTPDIFEQVIGRDRYCRADWYYNNQLYFRGYVDPSTYDEPMLPGLQNVTILATDGLGALKEIEMTGDTGQRLYGRRPWLNTVLHCLSRCDVSLPVQFFTNRRDAAMATTDAPEEQATTDRTSYWDAEKDTPWLMRKVLEGVAQAAGGTLMQRGGTWQVRSLLEAATDTEGRAYRPAGTPTGLLTATAPTNTIMPPTQGPMCWLDLSQVKQVRAGWKSLTGKTDVGYLKNAYPPGEVFSDKNAWLSDASKLKATAGWRPAPNTTFPLLFSRLGDKGSAYTTGWLRSSGYSTHSSSQYLQGLSLPLAPGMEAVPAALQFTALFAPAEYYTDADGNEVTALTNAGRAVLPYELVIDGQSAGLQLVEFELAGSATDKPTVVSVPLPVLPTGATAAQLRLYAWYAADTLLLNNAPRLVVPGLQVFKKGEVLKYDFGTGTDRLFIALQDMGLAQTSGAFFAGIWSQYFAELTATNGGLGTLYLSEVGVALTPQGATWEGEDNYRADAAVGTIRPTDPLEVIHPDVPLAAGLRSGNLSAFSLGVALTDGTMSTSWRRDIDLDAAPLFEANVLDGLAQRDGATRLLTGVLEHAGILPPLLLDTLDAPFDVPGRRFAVCSTEWNTKLGHTEVSLVQNGVGAGAANPYNFSGKVLITDRLYQWQPGQFVPYALGTDDGSLLSWD